MNKQKTIKLFSLLGVLILAVGAPPVLSSIYWTSVLILMVINILMASSLRTVMLIGEFSLGHVGFMCLGAYSSALMTHHLAVPFGLAVLLSGVISGLLALILGYPFMRVKAVYFIILTLVTSETIRNVALNWDSLTGGSQGMIGFPGAGILKIPGLLEVDFGGFTEYYYLVLTIVIISLSILYLLEKSMIGFVWVSIRDSDRVAGSVGMNITRYKVICFSTACFFAGIAGSLMAHFEQTLSAQAGSTFGVMTTIYCFIYVVVGGKNRFAGPVLGTVTLTLVMELSRPIQNFQPMLIGVICIMVVFAMPDGLVAIPEYLSRQLQKLLQGKEYNKGIIAE